MYIRTWAAGAGTVDREYEWHELAQMWQTPEVGEQVMEAMTREAIAETLGDQVGGKEKAAAVGVAHRRHHEGLHAEALSLGRGRFAEWHDDVDRDLSTRPGVVFWGADDPYVTANFGERLAARTNATLVMFPSSGHWWPATEPAEVGARLDELWTVGG